MRQFVNHILYKSDIVNMPQNNGVGVGQSYKKWKQHKRDKTVVHLRKLFTKPRKLFTFAHTELCVTTRQKGERGNFGRINEFIVNGVAF